MSGPLFMLAPPAQQDTLQTPTGVAPPRRSPWRWLVPCLAVFLYLGASVGPALFDQNEAQYAGAVREMLNRPDDYLPGTRTQLERGQWYVPTNDGVPRLQKPPLVYWTLFASMSVFGVNDFAARLPNALASLAWFAGIYLVGRRVGGDRLGWAGATILATMAGTFIFCHLVAPEPFLAATLTLTFWCFLNACDRPGRGAGRWMFAAWVFMALGVLCKGLHGALYPLAVAAFLAWRFPATRPAWKTLLRPAGPLVFVALVVPWYVAVERRYPGFLWDQFINEQLGHVFNRRFPVDNSRVPFFVFWLEHLIFFLPWTFFIPAAVAERRSAVGHATNTLGRALLAAWFGVTALSVVFSGLQDYYLLTAWGPVALWLAYAWNGDDGHPRPGWTRLAPGVCLTVMGAAILSAALWLVMHTPTPGGATSTAIRDTMAGTLSGIPFAAWQRLLPLVWTTGAAFFLGGGASSWLTARGRWPAVLPVTAIAAMVVLGCAGRGLVVMENQLSLKELALVANRDTRPDTVVACVGLESDNPSILFYANREVNWVGVPPTMEFATRQLGIGKSLYLSDDAFLKLWSERGRAVYLIVEEDVFGRWDERLRPVDGGLRQEWRSGTRIMLCNGGATPIVSR